MPEPEPQAVINHVLDIRLPIERRKITVTTAALPDDLPTMFEAVTTDRWQNLVLRDESGGLWLATPLEPRNPANNGNGLH